MKIDLIQGDITQIKVDAIVNAANSGLAGGGGVDGAIHRAGGKTILEQCSRIVAEHGRCPAGNAVITSAGNLPAKFVIHAVGPVWRDGGSNEEFLLASAYRNCLRLALENGVKSIALPNISTGIYGFPKQKAAEISIGVVKDFQAGDPPLDRVIFVCFDPENYQIFLRLLGADPLHSP